MTVLSNAAMPVKIPSGLPRNPPFLPWAGRIAGLRRRAQAENKQPRALPCGQPSATHRISTPAQHMYFGMMSLLGSVILCPGLRREPLPSPPLAPRPRQSTRPVHGQRRPRPTFCRGRNTIRGFVRLTSRIPVFDHSNDLIHQFCSKTRTLPPIAGICSFLTAAPAATFWLRAWLLARSVRPLASARFDHGFKPKIEPERGIL